MTKLLVSTSLSLLEVDLKNNQIRTIHQGKGLYYGISIGKDGHIWSAARNRMASSGINPDSEHGSLLVFDRNYNLIEEISPEFALRDMHQIKWNEDSLWITCSRDNSIVIYNRINWEIWYPLPEDYAANHDVHHYNSLMFADNGVWLLAHNFGNSELLHFELPQRRLQRRIPLGQIAHNIWREDGLLTTLSSGDGTMVDERGGTRTLGGFPRGHTRLADGSHVIGVNEYAERALRDKTTSRIQIYDSEWNSESAVQLDGEGMILDIQLAPDDA